MSDVPDVKNLGVHNNKLTTKKTILTKLHFFQFVSRVTVDKEVTFLMSGSKFNINSVKKEQNCHTTCKSSVKTSEVTPKNSHY